jgi:hypothetical protein
VDLLIVTSDGLVAHLLVVLWDGPYSPNGLLMDLSLRVVHSLGDVMGLSHVVGLTDGHVDLGGITVLLILGLGAVGGRGNLLGDPGSPLLWDEALLVDDLPLDGNLDVTDNSLLAVRVDGGTPNHVAVLKRLLLTRLLLKRLLSILTTILVPSGVLIADRLHVVATGARLRGGSGDIASLNGEVGLGRSCILLD